MAITDALHQYNLRYFENIEAPVFDTPVYDGTVGALDFTYVATYITINGETTASEEVTVEDCSTLSENDTITLSVKNIPAAARTIKFYRKNGEVYNYIGTSTVAVNSLVDYGLTESASIHPPETNISGRSGYHFIGFRTDRPLQRMEMIDQQTMLHQQVEHLADVDYVDGDIISGLSLHIIDAEAHTYSVDGGVIYFNGLFITVPASGTLTLTGEDDETINLQIEPIVVTYEDDPKLRNLDDNIPIEYYNLPGADRISAECTWCVNTEGAVVVHSFENGIQKIRPLAPERTKLMRDLAVRTNDLCGDFVANNFQVKVLDDPADETKLNVRFGPGLAYIDGYRVDVPASRMLPIDKPRTTKEYNNNIVGTFLNPGGYLFAGTETYDVAGKSIQVKFGSGHSHVVTFYDDAMTAAQVVEQILDTLPEHIILADGFACSALEDTENFILRASYGKDLTIETPDTPDAWIGNSHAYVVGDRVLESGLWYVCLINHSSGTFATDLAANKWMLNSEAYTDLGITTLTDFEVSTFTYKGSGRRIYNLTTKNIKTVSDFTYVIETTVSKTRGTGDRDLLVSNLYEIVGVNDVGATADDKLKSCHDGDFSHVSGDDFSQDGNYIVFNNPLSPVPNNTYYVTYRYMITPTLGERTLVRVTDGKVLRSAVDTDTIALVSDVGTTAIDVSTGLSTTAPTGTIEDIQTFNSINSALLGGGVEYTSVIKKNGVTSIYISPSSLDWSDCVANPAIPTGQPGEGSYYYVSFDYWRHDVEGDYVCADSYSDYDLIPQAPNRSWHLRDCLDFRTDGRMPYNGYVMQADYEAYLARADRFGLDSEGNAKIIYGTPDDLPEVPKDTHGMVSLAVLKMLPYVYSADTDVVTVSTEPMRITQAGIREMQRRLDRLEYSIATTVMENDTENANVGLSTSGFFTDSCINTNKVDLGFSSGGTVHNAALDRYNGCFRLPDTVGEGSIVYLNWNDTDSENIISSVPTGSVLTLLYQPTIIDSQVAATDTININPNPTVSYLNGNLTLDPAGDAYFDTTQLPDQVSELDTNMQQMLEYISPENVDRTDWGQWHYTCNNQPAPPPGTAVAFSASAAGGNFWHSVTYEQFKETTRQGQIWGVFHGQHNQSVGLLYDYDTGAGTIRDYIEYGAVRVLVTLTRDAWGRQTMNPISDADIDKLWAAYYQECVNYWSMWGFHQSFSTTNYPIDRDGVHTQIVPERQEVDLGDRVVDISAVPMMRTSLDDGSPFYITITANSLMPNAAHTCVVGGKYVDLIPVGDYDLAEDETIKVPSDDSQAPDGPICVTNEGELTTYSRTITTSNLTRDAVKTNASGEIVAKFSMPWGIPSGSTTVMLRHKLGAEYSMGICTFNSQGFTSTKQGTTLGLTTSTIRRNAVNQTGTCYATTGNGWVAADPIAQTFFTGRPTYISAVDIYFATKSDTVPVTCDIRKVDNGYVTKEVIVSATLAAQDITTSVDGSVATRFTFEQIKLFQPEEYAIVLLTDCQDYNVYIGTGGLPDLVTGNPYNAQQHLGVLWQSMNNSTWTPINVSDLKFRLWQSNFMPYGTIVFTNITGFQAGILSTRVEQFLGPGTNATWFYQLPTSLEWISFDPIVDKELDEIIEDVKLKVNVTSSGGAYQLDLKKSAIILKTNKETGDYISQSQEFPDAETQPDELVIVMTAQCDGFGAENTDGTVITPYYSVDNGLTWVEVDYDVDEPAVNKDFPYKEYTFRTPPEQTITNVSGTNNQPLLVTVDGGHALKENQNVYCAGNSEIDSETLYTVSDVTDTTFKLKVAATGDYLDSDGSTVEDGTVTVAPFSSLRTRIHLYTSVASRTPRFKNLRVIANISQ